MRRRFWPWILLALAILPVFFLHLTALRAADDFYYATFWMDGPAAFWQLTLQHYQTFNGRALVHFVAQTVLAFPPVVFATANTALLLGVGHLGGLLQGESRKSCSHLYTAALFLALLLLLPTAILTEGLLWASASYNYMLPVFLTVLALWLLSRFLEQERKGPLFFLLFTLAQLAAGATTEQCGFMAVAATGLYGLVWAVQNRKSWWKLLPAPLLCALGLLTVFLSPATRHRAETGADLGDLGRRLARMAAAYLAPEGILLPLILTAALLTVCLSIPRVRREVRSSTFALLAGGLASAVIMLPTGNFEPRTMLPLTLILLLVSARCASLLLGLSDRNSFAPILCGALTLALCTAVCSPLLAGAAGNYALETHNRAAVRTARETGVLHYSIDYDTRWCYPSLMYTEGSFYFRFLQSNGLEHATVYLESEVMKSVYLNGQRLSSPGYEQDGKVFFPLRDVIEGFGGAVTYSVDGYTVTLDGREVKLWTVGVASWSDGGWHEYPIADKTARRYCKASYTAELYRDLFGISITLEGDRYVCSRV